MTQKWPQIAQIHSFLKNNPVPRQQISNFSYCDNFQIIEYHNDSDACDYLLSISLAYSKIKIELDKLQPFSIIENLTAGCLVSDPEDLWMQQLMCVNGVSFEKAEAIVDKWSSCKVFRTALKRETNPEKMVKDVKYTVRSNILVRLRNLIIFEVFRVKFSAKIFERTVRHCLMESRMMLIVIKRGMLAQQWRNSWHGIIYDESMGGRKKVEKSGKTIRKK